MSKEIPTHDPYTGELNPYYEELTGQINPLKTINKMETFYIKEEKLDTGKSRYYPILKMQDHISYWNEEYILRKWYPAEEQDYCDSYNLALSAIDKHKEYLKSISPNVVETIDHQID